MSGCFLGARLCSALPILVAVLCLFVVPCSFAQTNQGHILGTVQDSTGALVPNAKVAIVSLDTGFQRQMSVNENGAYDFSNVDPGKYRVEVESPGFKKYVLTETLLEASASLRVDPKLEVGEVTQSVEVQALAPVINTEDARIAGNLEHRQFTDVVMGGRGLFNWQLLIAGTMYTGNGYTMNGSRSASNGYTIDGVDVGNAQTGTEYQSMRPDQEMVREMREDSVSNSAEYAHSGTQEVTLASGTNRYHGQATWNVQNGVLNAKNFFAATRPPGFPINNWFFDMGGPVTIPKIYNGRDRTFFYFHWDGQERRAWTTRVFNVPTAAMRTGNFSGVGTVNDPLTGKPFPDNIIPAARISQVATKYENRFYPNPTLATARPAANFVRNLKDGDVRSDRAFSLRVDQKLTSANTIYGRYWMSTFDFHGLDGQLPPEIIGPIYRLRQTRSAILADTHVFSPSLVNEARLGFARFTEPLHSRLLGADTVGLVGLTGYPTALDAGVYGNPNVTISGLLGVSAQNTSNPVQQHIDLVDNITWERKGHSLKFGFNVQHANASDFPSSPSAQFGTFNFDGFATTQPFADFLLGVPHTSTFAPEVRPFYGRGNLWGAYIQDNWRVTRRLNVGIGVRLDRYSPWTEKTDRMYNFDPKSGSVVVPDGQSLKDISPLFPSNIPITTASKVGFPGSSLIGTTSRDFAPRLGFAYRSGIWELVFRGGYGIYYNGESRKAFNQMTTGPFVPTATFDNTLTAGNPLYAWPQAFPVGAAARPLGAVDIFAVSPDLVDSYVHQWNFSIEKQLGVYGLRFSYIGDAARQLPYLRNLNQPPASTTAFNQNRRPYPTIRNITYADRGANQSYNALQFEVRRRLLNGLLLDAHYTWARTLTDSPDVSSLGGTIEDAYNRRRDWGNENGIPASRFITSFVYEVPIGTGRKWLSRGNPILKGAIGGWSISGDFGANSGLYFTPTYAGRDISNTNVTTGRPDRVCDGNLIGSQTIARVFDVSCYVVPTAGVGRFGTAGRNTVVGPGYWGVNTGLYKYFPIPGSESMRFRFQGMIQNLANHPKFQGPPDLNILSPTAGQFLATGGGHGVTDISANRLLELGIRFEW